MPGKILRPDQELRYSKLARHIASGEQDILLTAPMGWGKSVVIQYLAAELLAMGLYTHVVIVVPSLVIRGQWSPTDPIEISYRGSVPVFYAAHETTTKDLAREAFWRRDVPQIYVVTTNAIWQERVRKAIFSLASCSRILFIGDEGHHHVEKVTLAGDLFQALRERGAASIRITGTPWHARGDVKTPATKTVTMSQSEFARVVDRKTGLHLAPHKWRMHKVLVDFSSEDYRHASERQGMDVDLPQAFAQACIISMVDRWVEDGCPKSIFRIPLVAWALPLLEAIRTDKRAQKILGRKPSIMDLVGQMDTALKKACQENLALEASSVMTWRRSRIDAIVTCSRGDEGLDWPLCSHVYFVRIPNSPRLILQSWSRASRCKHKIEGYPAKWAESQTITFFIPLLSEDAKEKMMKVSLDMALILAAYLEDPEEARRWAVETPAMDRFARMSLRGKTREAVLSKALEEMDLVASWDGDQFERATAQAKLVKRFLQAGGSMDLASAGREIDSLGGSEEENDLLIQGLMHLARGADPNLDQEIRRMRKKAWIPRGEGALIRPECRAAWDRVAKDFGHVIITVPDRVMEIAAEFTASTAQDLVGALREWSVPLICEEGEKYKEIHGRYPSSQSGPWEGFGGKTWYAADWQLKQQGSSLAVLFGRQDKIRTSDRRSIVEKIQEIRDYFHEHGRAPDCHTTKMGRNLVRFRADPECRTMLIEAGIPLKGHDDVQARIERILAFRAENGHWPFVRLRKGTKCQASRDYATIIRNKKHHDAAKAAGIPLEVDMRESIVVSKRLYQGIVAYKIGSVVSHVGARWHSEGRPNQKTAGKVIGDLSFKGLDSAIRDGMRGLGEDLERCHVRSISDLCDEIEANCWLFQVDGCRQKVLWSRVLADGLQIDVSTPATRTHFLIWKPPHPSRHKWTLHDHQ